ncbi:MAG TPA: hypothetical protein VLA09_10450 [Longimicrobiales bacterium]|nr:hypothetical protein [Longimicrobiales bacterium]
MSPLPEIERVEGRRGLARFIDVPWHLHDPAASHWIPPLRVMVRDALDREGNPFYAEADRALFVARRGGRTVGRVAAIENRWHNRHHGDRVGFFGFFECAEDDEAANRLLGAAESWLAERGLDRVRGPISPSMNHECGVLVAGFDRPPTIMTPWNPPYYDDLLKRAGLAKAQDVLGFDMPGGSKLAVPDRVRRLAERTRRNSGITFRSLDMRTLEREARKVRQLYNEAWAGNWGFVPPSWDEFWHLAKDLKSVLAPDMSFVAERGHEVVGFLLMALDINRVLGRIPSGRLWPWNLARLLLGVPKITSGRVLLLGLKAEWRHRGLFPLFAYETARRAFELGWEGAEASWVLDDNEAMVAPLEAMGFLPYKRWRIYEKRVSSSGRSGAGFP